MKSYKEKIEYLNNYYYLVKECKLYELKIAELREDIEAINSPLFSDMPKGGIKKSLDDYIAELLEFSKKLANLKLKALETYLKIDSIINGVNNGTYRLALKLRYIEHRSLDFIAKELAYTKNHIIRILKKGLEEIELI